MLCRLLENPIKYRVSQAEHVEREHLTVSGRYIYFQMKSTFLSEAALDEHKLSCAFARAEALAQVLIQPLILTLILIFIPISSTFALDQVLLIASI